MIIIPGSMSLLNCEIFQRGRLSRVGDREIILLIAHLIQPSGSIPGLGWVRKQTANKTFVRFVTRNHAKNFKEVWKNAKLFQFGPRYPNERLHIASQRMAITLYPFLVDYFLVYGTSGFHIEGNWDSSR